MMKDVKQFLRNLNEAFVKNDSDFILTYVTEDIRWNIIGERVISGKQDFEDVLNEMETNQAFELRIDNIISEDSKAVVNGSIKPKSNGETTDIYYFCDIYGFVKSKEPKISAITSYVIEENN